MASLSPEELGRWFADRWNDGDARTIFLSWRDRLSIEDWSTVLVAFEQRSRELEDATWLEDPALLTSLEQMAEQVQQADHKLPPEWATDTS